MKHVFAAFALVLLSTNSYAYEKHSINWPTSLSRSNYSVGGLLHQFQNFGESYFHEGVDILTPTGQSVFAPVSGQVDAGYYSYETLPTGLSEKTYISIKDIAPDDKKPKLWGENYFEVSITDAKGFRFEIHHIKRESLSANLVSSIMDSQTVPVGVELGTVVKWPQDVKGQRYDHIHYSILNSEGHYLNPFWFSTEVQDNNAPSINSIYAAVSQKCSTNGLRQLKELSQVNSDDQITHIVVLTQDLLGNNLFPQPPTRLEADFEDGSNFTYDYSQALFTDAWNSYSLRELYVGRFCIGTADFPFVLPGSESFKFYIQIPVPTAFKGSVKITASDFANNSTSEVIEL